MKRLALVITAALTLVLVMSVISAPVVLASPIIHVPLSGNLAPNQSNLYGPYSLHVGSTVYIKLTWSPSTSTLAYGVAPSASSQFQGCTKSGGAGECKITIQTAGSYYIIVSNKSPNSIIVTSYNGYADIDICPPCL
jgi:hypothetical protein